MNGTRVDRIEETLGTLLELVHGVNATIDGVGQRLDAKIDEGDRRLEARIDSTAATIRAETQDGFDDARKFAEFIVERSGQQIRDEMRQGFSLVDARFDLVDHRFNAIERRFDRLEERLFGDR